MNTSQLVSAKRLDEAQAQAALKQDMAMLLNKEFDQPELAQVKKQLLARIGHDYPELAAKFLVAWDDRFPVNEKALDGERLGHYKALAEPGYPMATVIAFKEIIQQHDDGIRDDAGRIQTACGQVLLGLAKREYMRDSKSPAYAAAKELAKDYSGHGEWQAFVNASKQSDERTL